MFNKNRLMCRYYSTLLQWPLRRFWRWGVVLQPGEYRDTLRSMREDGLEPSDVIAMTGQV